MWKESTRNKVSQSDKLSHFSKEILASMKLDRAKAVSQLENITQALFELNPHDDEPEYWMEETLTHVYDCFDNIGMYYAERAMSEAKLW